VRVEAVRVGGFGMLADLEVSGLGAGTTVVCGPNESGKSTLHSFLVRTLFGHPATNDARKRHRHEPLRGGRHGGSLDVLDGDGGRWHVHRYTTGTPRFRVVAPDGSETTGRAALVDLVGRGMDEERFEQVFAIDLDALSGLGSLAGPALDELLLDAATVGAGNSLRAAIRALEERRRELWTPGAQVRPLNAELRSRRDAEGRLRAAREAAAGYQRACAEVARLDGELDRIRDAQTGVAGDARRRERLLAAWEPWGELRDAQVRLAAAGEVVVPDGLVDEIDDLRRRQLEATEAADQRRADAAELEAAVAATEVDDRLAAVAVEVAEHAGALPLQVDRRGRLERAEERARSTAAAADTAVRGLGEGWDEIRVRATVVGPTVLPTVTGALDELREARAELVRAETGVEVAGSVLAGARQRAAASAAAVGEAPAGDVTARRAAVTALGQLLPDLERRRDREHERQAAGAGRLEVGTNGGSAARWPLGLAAAATVALLALGGVALVTGVVALGSALLVVAALVGLVAVGVWRGARPTSTSLVSSGGATTAGHGDTAGGVGTTVPDLEAEVAAAADVLGLGLPVDRQRLAEADHRTAQLEEARRDHQRRAERAERDEDAVALAGMDLARAEEVRAERAAALEQAEAGWVVVRDRVGLDESVPPAAAPPLLLAVTEARRAIEAADLAARGRDALAAEVAAFDAVTDELCGRAGRQAAGSAGSDDVAGSADEALRRLEADRRADLATRAERDRSQRAAADARGDAEEHDLLRAQLETDLAAAYTRVGAASAAAFDEVVTRDGARRQAEDDVDTAERELRRHLGDDDTAAELREELATGRVTLWADDLDVLRERAARLAEERDELVSQRTTAAAELERLGTDEAVPTAALEVETHRQRCVELAGEWATTHLAAELLRATLQRFETAHQPAVLDRAGELLAEATAKRWAQVRRIDDELYVAADGDPVPVTALSRGATEQLYLCLRLALAEELNGSGPRLPLLIDDLVANTDPERAEGIARILAEVATDQQVIVFTCDPATADRVTAADPTAGVLTMQPAGEGATWARRPAR
jgi:uncharacterized protein YhaN